MKLSHLFGVIAICGVGCGGAIAQDLGSSDAGSQEGDSAVVHPTNGRDAGELFDASDSVDASRTKDAARTDANPTFPCGGILICDRETQICKEGEGGPAGNPPSFQCDPIPAACSADVTCDCMKTAIGANACTDNGGAITVQFFYP
jgi:hypothetical protein